MKKKTCPECEGRKKLMYHDFQEDIYNVKDCYKCNGTGLIKGEPAGENMDWYEPCECRREK